MEKECPLQNLLREYIGASEKDFDRSVSLIDLHYECFIKYDWNASYIIGAFDSVFSQHSTVSYKHLNEQFRLLLLISHLLRDANEILTSLKKNQRKQNSHHIPTYAMYIAQIHAMWKIHENGTSLDDILIKIKKKCEELGKFVISNNKLTYYVQNYVFSHNRGYSSHIDFFINKVLSSWKRNDNLKMDKNTAYKIEKYVSKCVKIDKEIENNKEKSKNKSNKNKNDSNEKQMEYVYQRENEDPLSCVGSSILGNWPIEYKNDNGPTLEKMAILMEDVRKQQRRARNEDQLKKENETLDDEFEIFWNENYSRWDMIDHHCFLDQRIWDWRVKIKYDDAQIDKHLTELAAKNCTSKNQTPKK